MEVPAAKAWRVVDGHYCTGVCFSLRERLRILFGECIYVWLDTGCRTIQVTLGNGLEVK
jgi:hypothetical protein